MARKGEEEANMKIGFTGSRIGMTRTQMDAFYKFIWVLPAMTEFHHGACVGADAEAADMTAECGWENGFRPKIVAYPCDFARYVSAESKKVSDDVMPVRAPLDRNKDIVDACELLIAAPHGPEEQRSGTWSTVRYARRKGKRIAIVWPDGTITQEGI